MTAQVKSAGMLLCIFALSAFCGCSEKPAVSIADKDNGKTVSIEKGKLLEVKLGGTMGTGYSWILARPNSEYVWKGEPKLPKNYEELMEPTGDSTVPLYSEKEQITGGPNETVFLLKAKKQGKTTLHFVYIRVWEKDKAPEKVFSVDVDIN